MSKIQLQQLAQKSGHPLPTYTTIMEGPAHLPQFKTSVVVKGVRFEPPEKFSSKKESEKHATRVAYEELQKKERNPLQLIGSDVTFCRTILQEFSVKMNLQKPEYKCFLVEGLLPVFFSTVELSGSAFQGVVGRNKHESNQLAARAAIQSILVHGYPEWKTAMTQIVRSKSKLYATISRCQTKVVPDGHVAPPQLLIRPMGSINQTQTNVNPDGHVAQPQLLIAQQEQPVNGEPRMGPIDQIKIKPDPDGHVAQSESLVAQLEQLPRETFVEPGCQSHTNVDQNGHVVQSQPLSNGETFISPVEPIGQSRLNVDPDGHVAQPQPLVQSEEQPIRVPQNTPVGPGSDEHMAQSQVELAEQPIGGSLNIPVGPGSQSLIYSSGHMAQPLPLIDQQEERSKDGALSTPGGPGSKSQIGTDSGGQQDEKVNRGAVEMEEEPETENPVVNTLTFEGKAEESVEEPERENSAQNGNVKRLKIAIM